MNKSEALHFANEANTSNIVSLNLRIGHEFDSYVAFDNAFVQHIQKSRFQIGSKFQVPQ